jgi:hypothetical protein
MALDRRVSLSIYAPRTRLRKSASQALSSEIMQINQEVTDDVLAYVIDFQPAYSTVRRLVGLVAGMLLLSQSRGKTDAVDWSAIGGARETWNETEANLRRLQPPASVEGSLRHLKRAHQLIGSCLYALGSPEMISNETSLQLGLRSVADSYRHLQCASLPGLGVTMVDFSHGCCGGHDQLEQGRDSLGRK